MKIILKSVDETNRDAVIALSVREDQPFVAPNDYSLKQAEETNAEYPGVARPFAIYAEDRLVGFCMFSFAPEAEDEDDRYWLWRFMIDKNEQGKGYGQAALDEITGTSVNTVRMFCIYQRSRKTNAVFTFIIRQDFRKPARSMTAKPPSF